MDPLGPWGLGAWAHGLGAWCLGPWAHGLGIWDHGAWALFLAPGLYRALVPLYAGAWALHMAIFGVFPLGLFVSVLRIRVPICLQCNAQARSAEPAEELLHRDPLVRALCLRQGERQGVSSTTATTAQ